MDGARHPATDTRAETTTVTTGTLAVDGATLHYQLRGTGPLLLISQSGEGDADRSADLVAGLADAYTVLTYDRRGLSRSRVEDPASGASIAQHADDVHRLLAAVTDEPALMLGCSLGASIGLHLATTHPGQIALLIAHEPVSPCLLPTADRARHEHELAELQGIYRRAGLADVFPAIAGVLGIDPHSRDVEPDLTPFPLDAQRRANFDYFIQHDFTAIIEDTLDAAALAASSTRIVPAFGATTPHTVFDYQCALALADLTGTPAVTLPGGHNGNLTHPRAYAALLRELLAGAA
ncbi:alpha/beta fold hydrolase [Yinghuangia seranimata]|uniref:alpha/beta fold hydrolase n=1 Tax=Yinghuangia seranimata TaxID=408067 RepID=UPI00248B2FB7|nr:alpha/beta hydrolase [Yinghuangia seranimata]MDI2130655.1 alpha/beta hydrolase [Yinghuangia seranimata]